ncbi:MAG: rhodanese-like domain-containing protein [Patescibacteria group bacterium]|nr:rhodanese-like domain-containing protein [Patescibacteria group bacterium]
MAQKITTEELKKKIDGKENLYLIDTLSANSFEGRHIPAAKSVPFGADFMEKFEKEVEAPKDAEIITYCASSSCQASVLAANALEKAGYTNVKHFEDGIAGWQNAGYQFEGEAA